MLKSQANSQAVLGLRLQNMATPQAMRVEFLRGYGLMDPAHNTYAQAEQSFRSVISRLAADENLGTVAHAHYHLALALHQQQKYREASREHRASLDAADAYEALTGECDVELNFDNYLRRASQGWILMQFEDAQASLQAAWRLTREPVEADATRRLNRRAVIQWMRALNYRWLDAPVIALRYARFAFALHERARHVIAAPRILLVAADCALDIAAQQRMDRFHPDTLDEAAAFISDARRRIAMLLLPDRNHEDRRIPDIAGGLLGRLADLRLRRLSDFFHPCSDAERTDRRNEHADIISRAEGLHDEILLGQALIANGDELAVQGYADTACEQYLLGIAHLTPVAPTLATRAHRAIKYGGAHPTDYLI